MYVSNAMKDGLVQNLSNHGRPLLMKCSFSKMMGGKRDNVENHIYKLESLERQALHKVEIPKNANSGTKIKEPRVYQTPFIQFGYIDYLEVALSDKGSSRLDKYGDYINVRSKCNKSNRINDDGFLEMMMKYKMMPKIKLTQFDLEFPAPTQIKLPRDILDSAIHDLENITRDSSQIDRIVESYESHLSRFSMRHIIYALLNASSKLPKSEDAFTAITTYLIERLELLTMDDIEKMISLLLLYRQLPLVQVIIESYDKNDKHKPFMENASPQLKLMLLNSYIKAQNFQKAFEMMKVLKDVNRIIPPQEVVTEYVAMMSSISNTLKSTPQNKKLLFNAYTQSMVTIMRQPNIVNARLVSIILRWIDDSELIWFLIFLKTCPSHESSIIACSKELINRYSSVLTKQKKDDITNSICLTSFIKELGIPKAKVPSEVKYQIAKLYAAFGSPTATKMWYDSCKIERTADHVHEITDLLQSALKRRESNNLPGQSPQDIQNFIDSLCEK